VRSGRGAFVTLHADRSLRGCIGQMTSDRPLGETVIAMASAAAISDPRFTPVTPDELDRITLDISVLSPMRRVSSPDEVTPGVHGLLIGGRGRRGVLLPQVAVEYGWDREQFLNQTCLKAGLPSNAWRSDDITIEVFTAEVIIDKTPIGREDP
jgi:AmmeMemoRadiSam system protein A